MTAFAVVVLVLFEAVQVLLHEHRALAYGKENRCQLKIVSARLPRWAF